MARIPTNEVGLPRRTLLQVAAAAGLTPLLGAGGNAIAARDPIRGVMRAGTPQRGGVLALTQAGDPPNFDIIANTTSRVIRVVAPCCNGLIRFDEFDPDKIVPDLAESWDTAADGLSYTFRLRPGLKFHDGKPCTSEDVKFTFDTMRQPPAGQVSSRSDLLSTIASIEAIDARTVRFNLKRPTPALLSHLAGGWMLVLPKHILAKGPMEKELVGTGPFKLKEYRRGVSLELVRNPDYHLSGRPYLDGIKYYFIPDLNTAYGYFRTGQLDVINPLAAQARQWEKEQSARAYMVAGHSTSSIALHFNTKQKPFDDLRVRQAMCLAIDRKEAVDTVYRGEGLVGGWSLPGPWALPMSEVEKFPGYGPYREANIARAKALLEAAGYPNGFRERLLVRRIPLFEPNAIFLQDQFKKIGVNVEIELQETAAYNQTVRTGQWRLDAGGSNFGANDPDSMFAEGPHCQAGQSCEAASDDLYMRQSQALNVDARRRMSHELERRALGQLQSFVMSFRNQHRLYQNNVHGWAEHTNEDNALRMEDCWKSRT